MLQLKDGAIYRIENAEGLALSGDRFGYHDGDPVVLQPWTKDLNQAWRLHAAGEGSWTLENLAAGQYLFLRAGYQFAYAPFILHTYGTACQLEERDGGVLIHGRTREGWDHCLHARGEDQPVLWAEGTPLRFVLLDEGKTELPRMLKLHGDVDETGVPDIMKDGDWYYLVCDRRSQRPERVGIKRARTLDRWQNYDAILPVSNPRPFPWMEEHVPGCDIWCPGIAHFGGKYRIYYSITKIYKNTSVMGMVTNVTLDKEDPRYEWVDEGIIMESREGDDWNAIDAHILRTYDDELWMVYGSSWSGIKTRRIDEATGRVADDRVYSLCYREEIPHPAEGGYLFKRNGWYYLIAAVERTDQNYRCVVGRSRDVRGPYLDKDGVDMLHEGGATLAEYKRGLHYPGHCCVFQEGDQYYLAMENTLDRCPNIEMAISTLTWEDDWPQSAAGRAVLSRFDK